MTIYEIDKAIENLIENSIDPETGELMISDDALEQLQMERDAKIENIALKVKELAATANAIKAEADRLAARGKAAENAAKRLKEYLKWTLHGNKFKSNRVSIYYNSRDSVAIEDEAAFIEWAKIHDDSLLKYADPKISLTAVKEKLDGQQEIPGASIVTNEYIVMR